MKLEEIEAEHEHLLKLASIKAEMLYGEEGIVKMEIEISLLRQLFAVAKAAKEVARYEDSHPNIPIWSLASAIEELEKD